MAIPREVDDERLKRVARYLHGHPDYMQWYPVPGRNEHSCFDHRMLIGPHAKNHVDRIQEGLCSWGDHLIAAWSRVQPRIALSSGEAELYAGMRGISEILGLRSSDA